MNRRINIKLVLIWGLIVIAVGIPLTLALTTRTGSHPDFELESVEPKCHHPLGEGEKYVLDSTLQTLEFKGIITELKTRRNGGRKEGDYIIFQGIMTPDTFESIWIEPVLWLDHYQKSRIKVYGGLPERISPGDTIFSPANSFLIHFQTQTADSFVTELNYPTSRWTEDSCLFYRTDSCLFTSQVPGSKRSTGRL